MDFIRDEVNAYLNVHHSSGGLADATLERMEKRASEEGFPIVGRMVGNFLELAARAVGAKSVFEMGSGFGYSAIWFARAVGPSGRVVLTDGDPENSSESKRNLSQTGLADRCTFLVGDALALLEAEQGDFDIVYCDIDKEDYPRAFQAARSRIAPGGLYLCDNVLWSGRVASGEEQDERTVAIREHNDMVMADPSFRTSIIPLRDGVMMALKVQ